MKILLSILFSAVLLFSCETALEPVDEFEGTWSISIAGTTTTIQIFTTANSLTFFGRKFGGTFSGRSFEGTYNTIQSYEKLTVELISANSISGTWLYLDYDPDGIYLKETFYGHRQ